MRRRFIFFSPCDSVASVCAFPQSVSQKGIVYFRTVGNADERRIVSNCRIVCYCRETLHMYIPLVPTSPLITTDCSAATKSARHCLSASLSSTIYIPLFLDPILAILSFVQHDHTCLPQSKDLITFPIRPSIQNLSLTKSPNRSLNSPTSPSYSHSHSQHSQPPPYHP